MRIATLGTGHMGRAIRAAFVDASHEVVFGSRNPDQTQGLPHWCWNTRKASNTATSSSVRSLPRTRWTPSPRFANDLRASDALRTPTFNITITL